MNKPLALVSVLACSLIALGLVASTPASAFHGSWWKGFGTARSAQGAVYNLEFYWGGQDAILNCANGGCQGTGDGLITLRDDAGLAVVTYPYIGTEDVRNVVFVNDPTWCAGTVNFPNPLEMTPAYTLTYAGGAIAGVQRNCLSTGINKNDFTGTLLDFALTVHAEGPFGVSHG
jgi:hypothetical protein